MTGSSTGAGDASPREKPARIWRRNLITWIALLLLVLLTLTLAYVPLGPLNMPIALAIAATKAFLVVVLFMELRFAKGFIRLTSAAALLWLLIMFTLTFSDFLMRPG